MPTFTISNPVTFVAPDNGAPVGWIPGPGELPARIKNDTFWNREELGITNETQIVHPINNGVVDPRDRVVMKLTNRPEWLAHVIERVTPDIWPKFRRRDFWCMGHNPPNDENAIDMLPCGSNLVNVIRIEGNYAILKVQNYDLPPDKNSTWKTAPQENQKQVLVRRSDLKTLVDRTGVGDLIPPFVAPGGEVAIETSKLLFYPAVPFDCNINGIPAIVTKLCFSGSTTYGLTAQGWQVLVETLVIGTPDDINLGGTSDDLRCYCDRLVGYPAPPVIGWVWTA